MTSFRECQECEVIYNADECPRCALAAELAALRAEHAAVVADRGALRRVVRDASLLIEDEDAGWEEQRDALRPAALRAAGDEPGAAAAEAALRGEP